MTAPPGPEANTDMMDNNYHYPSPQTISSSPHGDTIQSPRSGTASLYGEGKAVIPPTMAGLEPVPECDNLPEVVPTSHFREEIEKPTAGETPTEGRKPALFGLRRSTFILLVLLVAVIVIAAVGGGVGGSIAVQKAYDRGVVEASQSSFGSTEPDSSEPDTTEPDTPTATGDRIPPPPTYGILELDCPNLTDTTHKVTPIKETFAFKATCGSDYPTGKDNVDIISIVSYSFEDCMRACASFNERNTFQDTECIAVHFYADLQWVVKRGGNCWLKSKVGKPVVDEDPDRKDLHIKADLQD